MCEGHQKRLSSRAIREPIVELMLLHLSLMAVLTAVQLLYVDLRCYTDGDPIDKRIAQDFITLIKIIKALLTGLLYIFL